MRPIAARRGGVVDQVDATRIVIRATEDMEASRSGVDIYRLQKFQRSNQNTCINQRPLVTVGDVLNKGDIIADGPSTDLGDLTRFGRNVLFCLSPFNAPGGTVQLTRTSILFCAGGASVLRRLCFTLHPHRTDVRGDGAATPSFRGR